MTKTWEVEVRVNGESILTLGSSYLSGIENVDDYADNIRNCAQHLLSFIGDPHAPFQGKRQWDQDEHEGCSIDSERAFLLAHLRAMPSSLNDAMRTMEAAAEFITGHAQRAPTLTDLLAMLKIEEDRLRDVEGLRMGDVAMMFQRLRTTLTSTERGEGK